MASYLELWTFAQNTPLLERVSMACIVAAQAIITESEDTPNHANRKAWAAATLRNPTGMAPAILWSVLAANKAMTTEQITNATDAAIQTAVNNSIDLFAT